VHGEQVRRQIIVVGVNHKTAPIEVRERLAFAGEHIASALQHLQETTGLEECAILSTCNRVEIYSAVPDSDGVLPRLYDFLALHGQLGRAQLDPSLYTQVQPASIEHLFRVASGLDSMVLGETEITAQVKDAYALAHRHGAVGKLLHALFQRALHTAKEVRTHTGLSRGAASVGSVAVELARKIFGHLQHCNILLLGAGAVSELVLKHLVDRGATHVTIANRSLEQAVGLAEKYRGRATGLSRSHEELVEADVAITATATSHHVLTAEAIAHLMKARRQRPLFLVDLGVPRNIEPATSALENVYLYDIDDLQSVVADHRQEREQAVAQATAIVQRKVHHFMEWFEHVTEDDVPPGDAREPVSQTAS